MTNTIKHFLSNNPEYLNFLLLTAATILLSIAIHYLIFLLAPFFFRKSDRETIRITKKHAKKPSVFLILILVFFFLNKYFDIYFTQTYKQLFKVSLIFSFTWFAINIVKYIKYLILKNYDTNVADNLTARKINTQLKVFERIIIVFILIIAVSSALMTFESIRKLGVNLLTSAGIAGIIIGLAAQKSISGILAGIQIAITQPIRIDDVVIVENEWGWIEEINLTYVVVKIWDLRRLIVPIHYFIEKPFQNWTRTSAEILGTVFIYTDYHVPFNALRHELTNVLSSTSLWDGKVNVLQVTDCKETTIEIRALMSAKDSPTAWDLRVLVREKLIDFLQKNYPESLPKTRIDLKEANIKVKSEE